MCLTSPRFASTSRTLALVAAIVICLPGCQVSERQSPAAYPAYAGDPANRSLSRERAALERVLAESWTAERRESLQRATVDSFLPHSDRAQALSALLEQDEPAAEAAAARIIPDLPPSDWANELCILAAERGWLSCAGPLVVRIYWLRDPLERDRDADGQIALTALAEIMRTTDPAEALWRIVGDASLDALTQAAAWELYVALAGLDAARISVLGEKPGRAGLLADLHTSARTLHTVPTTIDEVIRLQRLLQKRTAHLGEGAREAPAAHEPPAISTSIAEALSPDQRRGLMLRHFPALEAAAACRPDLLDMNPSRLLGDLEQRLRLAHHIHPDPRGMVDTTTPAELSDWADELPFGDLVVISLLLDAAEAPAFQRALLEQIELDLADDGSEYGGLIVRAESVPGSCLGLVPFASAGASLGDVAFQPSPEMREQGITAIAEYHFHAQRRDNRVNAGPGRGDLRYAARMGAACLLATPCGRAGLNLDYFARLPSGRVCIVDLGTILPQSR